MIVRLKPIRNFVWLGFYLLCLSLFSLFAADNLDQVERIDYSKFTADNPYISVYFRAFDHQGAFIKDLKREEIELKINREIRDDFSLRRDFSSDEWLQVMTVVDISGSMSGKPLTDEKKALKTFAANLGIYDKISLITFNETPHSVIPFTRDKENFASEIDGITAKGNTSLYDAIVLAVEQTDGKLAPRKAIVVLSDGKDTISKTTYDEMLETVEKAKIPVFTIGLGKSNKTILNRISEISGGQYFFSPSSDDLLDVYFQIGEDLKNTYVLDNLKLHGIEDNEMVCFEISNLKTGKRTIYNHVPLNRTLRSKKEVIKVIRKQDDPGGHPISFKNLKQVVIGKNRYITIGLIFFILLLIALLWVFSHGKFLFLRIIITLLLILLYFVLQYIIFMV